MHGWSALRVSLNHFPRVASPPEGSLRITVNPLSGDFLVFRALTYWLLKRFYPVTTGFRLLFPGVQSGAVVICSHGEWRRCREPGRGGSTDVSQWGQCSPALLTKISPKEHSP